MEFTNVKFEGGNLMATVTFSKEDCKKWINDCFMTAIGKDFQYVLQAVKEKMIRDGEMEDDNKITGG